MISSAPISGAPISSAGQAQGGGTNPDPDPGTGPDPTPPDRPVVYPDPAVPPTTPNTPNPVDYATEPPWSVVVTLGGIDISSLVTGKVLVSGREGEAKTAIVSIVPASGALDLTTWMGAPIIIDYSGATVHRLFTGVVDVPTHDLLRGKTTFKCTDQLPQKVRNMTREQIDTEIGGYYSSIVYSEANDNWAYLQTRAATRPFSYDLDVNGSPQLTSWTPAATPHYSFDDDDFVLNSLDYSLVQASDLTNKINIKFEYRYQRKRQREREFSWDSLVNPLDIITAGHSFPTLNMITDAAEDKGGRMRLDYREYAPVSGVYDDKQWAISYDNREQLIPTIQFTVASRFTQYITETYLINLSAPQSQAQYGVLSKDISFGHATEFDSAPWEKFDAYEDAPASFSVSPNGDFFEDANTSQQDGRPAFDNAVKTIIAEAATAVKAAARKNYFNGITLIQPDLERSHTVYFKGYQVEARGKVFSFAHELDVENGSATTQITLALSKAINALPTETLPQVPTRADTSDEALTPTNVELPMRLGGEVSSPPYDEGWLGYTGNYINATGYIVYDVEVYPTRFFIPHEPVDAKDRSERNIEQSEGVDVAINNDLFVVTL